MKTFNWNVGLAIIRLGYKVRLHQFKPNHFSLRWNIGVFIIKCGYELRGDIPQKTWK